MFLHFIHPYYHLLFLPFPSNKQHLEEHNYNMSLSDHMCCESYSMDKKGEFSVLVFF